MAEATRSRGAPAASGEVEAVADAGGRGARLVATGSVALSVPDTWPSEGTIGVAKVSYDPPFFAGEFAVLTALRRLPEASRDNLSHPFQFESEEVLGYPALSPGRMTMIVSGFPAQANWAQAERTHITFREHFVGGLSSQSMFAIKPSASDPHPSARQALEDAVRWTGLSNEALGGLLGASRRSVYNWLRGRAMSSQFETRALRLQAALRPLAESRAPGEIAGWLQSGARPLADLVQEERWQDIEALVQEELQPRVLEPMLSEPHDGEPESYSAETRRAVLAALRSPPPVEQRRRPDWRPREVTGTSLQPDDEAE